MSNQLPSSDMPPPCIDTRSIWNIFTSEPGLGVAIIRNDGIYEYVNHAHAVFFLSSLPEQIIGRHLQKLLPEIVSREIIAALCRVSQTDQNLLHRVVWRGQQVHCLYRALHSKSFDSVRVLVSTRISFDDYPIPEDVEVIDAGFIELGELNALSRKELEVLALLGGGHRASEIAKMLFRSPKTIDSHLSSIRKKTRTTDRAVLMRIANEAGLNSTLLNRTRVRARRSA